MRASLTRILTPPVFDDPEKDRRAATLYPVLLGGMAVTIANFVLALLLAPNILRSAAINITICFVILISIGIVRRGHLARAMIVLTLAFWLFLTFVAMVVVGFNSAILSAYVAGAVLVGFFAGAGAVIAYSSVTSVVIFAAAWAEVRGLLPESVGDMTPYTAWLSLSAGLAITSILILLARRNTRDALEDVRRSERAAVETSHELEASTALLETRARQQATVSELGQAALGNPPENEFIDIAVKAVSHTLAVDIVTILECLEGGESFRLRAAMGSDDELLRAAIIPVERATMAGHTLLANEAVIVESWDTETRFARPLGSRGPGVQSSVSVVLQAEDAPYGVLGVHATARRNFSHDDVHFLQSVGNLLTLMLRRTEMDRALRESEEELRQAQKMEAVGRFAGGIAHDFNNMLAVITGYIEMLMRRLDEGDPARADAEEISHAAKRAAALVRQILAFSRRQVLQPEVVDLNEIVRKTKGMLGRIIGEDIALSIELDPHLAAVRADPGQIEQVLMNLAANARDAMPSGGRLAIETANATIGPQASNTAGGLDPGAYVRLIISDSGIGMSESTLAKVFDPFFTTKGLSEGTGLGLSTVYGIVRQSGGDITVTSESGRGTRFVVYLPQCGEVGRIAAASHAPAAVPSGNETVLLVEDEPGVRRLTRRMLEDLGYVVIEAENGLKALEIVESRSEALPLVVTDVIMPELGGGDLVERLTASHPETRVVYVSGYSDHTLGQDRLLKEGAVFLPKPFTQEELAQKLREVLD